MDFLAILGCDTSLYHSQGGATVLSLPVCEQDREFGMYINLARTPQFSAKLMNRNCYRLSRISWALAQISCTNCITDWPVVKKRLLQFLLSALQNVRWPCNYCALYKCIYLLTNMLKLQRHDHWHHWSSLWGIWVSLRHKFTNNRQCMPHSAKLL